MNESLRIFNIHKRYVEFFHAFPSLPFQDIISLLTEEMDAQRQQGWQSLGDFLNRVEALLVRSKLGNEKQEAIAGFLANTRAIYERGRWLPEERPEIHPMDEGDLRARDWLLASKRYCPEQDGRSSGVTDEETVALRRITHARVRQQEVERRLSQLGVSAYVMKDSFFPESVMPSLEPSEYEKDRAGFHGRIDEFLNIIKFSFSTTIDDASVRMYDASGPVQTGSGWFWCPLPSPELQLREWNDFTHDQKQAIRLGYAHGLSRALGLRFFEHQLSIEKLTAWQGQQTELSARVYQQYIVPIQEQAQRTGHYGFCQARMEELLEPVYDAGIDILHHPLFELSFTKQLAEIKALEMVRFLQYFSIKKHVTLRTHFLYLLSIVQERLANGFLIDNRPIKLAISWLHKMAYGIVPGKIEADMPILQEATDTFSTDTTSIVELCRHPFSRIDLDQLFVHLKVIKIEEEGIKLVGAPWNGKAKGKISAFVAVYEVLSEKIMFESDRDAWPAATLSAYGIKLGKKVLGYRYRSKNDENGSAAYDAFYDKAQEWIRRWNFAHPASTDA